MKAERYINKHKLYTTIGRDRIYKISPEDMEQYAELRIQQEREKWKEILKEEIVNLYVEANTSCDCEDCKKIKDKDRIFANNYFEEEVKPRIESK